MIDRHTSTVLEFPKVMSFIRDLCLTPYGREAVDELTPLFSKPSIETRSAEIEQLRDIYNFGTAFPLYRSEDCRELLARSTVQGGFLDPPDILLIGELIDVAIALHEYDRDHRVNFPEVTVYLKAMRSFPDLKKSIERTIDKDGLVRDRASTALKRIRSNLFDNKRRIVSQLEQILSSQQKQAGWQDDVITLRNDRYVIPVLSGQYKADQGILHDRSQSGATFYVEPRETVEMNNRINMLRQEERAEVARILRALTSEIGMQYGPLRENIRLIGQLDARYAAAKFGNEIGAVRPRIDDTARFDIHEGRHPLLVKQFGSAEKVVPISLALNDDNQALLITGPNTGGKTVALKTVGLVVMMAQSGLLVPADEKTTVGIFRQVYADIGDEQSIELSLSTFSSHIKNIAQALDGVSPDCLVLLDEIGAGTDPKEGASLAEAIILHLVKRGARLIASTHYSQLKTLALQHPEIENASLEFNRKTLAPTYRLRLGIPGSSYAVEIASRLGIARSICDHASQLVGSSERSLGELIASLETELAQIRQDKDSLAERLIKVKELEQYYRTQTDKFEREIEERRESALDETDSLLETTRKDVEKLVSDIRHKQAESEKVKQTHRYLGDAKAKADRVRSKNQKSSARNTRPDKFAPEDQVRIISLNQEGELVELIGNDRARIQVGAVNTVVRVRNLEKLTGRSQPKMPAPVGRTPAPDEASREIHLRGMTVEEAVEALDRFIDQSVVGGLQQIYVIHGKGTGRLRKKLTGYLQSHPEVDSLRLGNWNEGGAGVTIVKLKA